MNTDINMRTKKELLEADEYLWNFDSYLEYRKNLRIVFDTLDFVMTELDSLRENYNLLADKYCNLLGKNTPKKPVIWEEKYYYSPIPNDDCGYECPCCGNREIDYPDHHCTCGQALDWSEELCGIDLKKEIQLVFLE
jgi:hypothetical protein